MTRVHSTISPSQGEIASMTSERRTSSNIMAETINIFNELTIQSTIKDSAYYDSEEDDTERDPNIYPKVANYTTNVNPPHKLFINWLIPDAACSGARILRTTGDVIRMGRDGTTPRDRNTAVAASRLTSPVRIFHSTTNSPSWTGNQDIINPRGPVGPQRRRNVDKLKTSINGFF